MLNIHEVDMDDVGQYACVATNRLGSCTTVGELNIQGFCLLMIYTGIFPFYTSTFAFSSVTESYLLIYSCDLDYKYFILYT